MLKDSINDEYFEWLYDLGCKNKFSKRISYRKLFVFLHQTEFTYTIPRDKNRACDGIDLRYRFVRYFDYDDDIYDALSGPPCSVLEMLIALAIRGEENIAGDPAIGDRTGQWFWDMMKNLGISDMSDSRFDQKRVLFAVERFMNREYSPDGRGGLFTIKNCEYDLRDVEIWYQLQWYLGDIIG